MSNGFDKSEAFLVHVFASDSDYDKALVAQNMALNKLTKQKIILIAKDDMDAVGSFSKNKAKSTVIGYGASDSDDHLYETGRVVLISPLVAEKVYTKFMKIL